MSSDDKKLDLPRDIELYIQIPQSEGFIVGQIMEDGERVPIAGCSESSDVASWCSRTLRHYDKDRATYLEADSEDWILPRMFQRIVSAATGRLAK